MQYLEEEGGKGTIMSRALFVMHQHQQTQLLNDQVSFRSEENKKTPGRAFAATFVQMRARIFILFRTKRHLIVSSTLQCAEANKNSSNDIHLFSNVREPKDGSYFTK